MRADGTGSCLRHSKSIRDKRMSMPRSLQNQHHLCKIWGLEACIQHIIQRCEMSMAEVGTGVSDPSSSAIIFWTRTPPHIPFSTCNLHLASMLKTIGSKPRSAQLICHRVVALRRQRLRPYQDTRVKMSGPCFAHTQPSTNDLLRIGGRGVERQDMRKGCSSSRVYLQMSSYVSREEMPLLRRDKAVTTQWACGDDSMYRDAISSYV
jgi:hypothetical protein